MTLNINLSSIYEIKNLEKINVILGKNGCGKSTFLKKIEELLLSSEEYGVIKYITPERGGVLTYEPGIDHNIINNPNWMKNSRRTNRLENFRQQSVAQFRNLEILFNRELSNTPALRIDFEYNFKNYFNKLNSLLDNIEIKEENSTFQIYKKGLEEKIPQQNISSGESELISLGIECLVFEKECIPDKLNILLLDEPDVHLHPDLQARLSHFLYEVVRNKNAIVILATHSTAILGALGIYEDTAIEFMSKKQNVLKFKKITNEYRQILPIFGAHPLSNVFNQSPVLLVEGEDDERIWQQAIRTSNKSLKIYPCAVDGINNLKKYEKIVEEIMASVYENAMAFSLYDRDDTETEINDLEFIQRFKLNCRAAENLLLTDEVLITNGISWSILQEKIDSWLEADSNKNHKNYEKMKSFKELGYKRKSFDLKEIRNDLMCIMEKPIAWEIAIGKTIGNLISSKKLINNGEDCLLNYLGQDLIDAITKDR